MLRGKGQDAGHFTWLNNGAGIITVSFLAASSHLEAIEFASGAGRILTTGALRDIAPALPANGGTLAFASGEVGYDIIRRAQRGDSVSEEWLAHLRVEEPPDRAA